MGHKFLQGATIEQAEAEYPGWIAVEVDGGAAVFETVDQYQTWLNQA